MNRTTGWAFAHLILLAQRRMIVKALEGAIFGRIDKRRGAKVEPALLEGHERGRRKEPIDRVARLEQLLQHLALHPVQAEDDFARVQIEQTAEHRTARPHVQVVLHRFRLVPDQLPAAVERDRVRVVPDAVALVAEEVGILGRPADLHHARCHDQHLVVPAARIHLVRAPDALERVRVAAGRQPVGRDFQVLADVARVEHHVHVADVRHLV